MSFSIDVPSLSRGVVDRSEDLREPARLMAAWAKAKVLVLGPGGQLPVAHTAAGSMTLSLADAGRLAASPPAGAVLLGCLDGTDYWAMPEIGTGQASGDGQARQTIRAVGPLLSDDEAALATTAVALLQWQEAASFCSRCGQPMIADISGHSRRCRQGHQEFPRTDPAVIVLVHDGADHAVLARQPSWAPGRFSVLAGFAEAGESLESTVAREMAEEVGVAVTDVEYLGSQPWPFPRSLMIAFAARAPEGALLRPRPGEIEQARWFSREQLHVLLENHSSESPTGDSHSGIHLPGEAIQLPGEAIQLPGEAIQLPGEAIQLPGELSIARRMVEGFVGAQ